MGFWKDVEDAFNAKWLNWKEDEQREEVNVMSGDEREGEVQAADVAPTPIPETILDYVSRVETAAKSVDDAAARAEAAAQKAEEIEKRALESVNNSRIKEATERAEGVVPTANDAADRAEMSAKRTEDLYGSLS